MWKAIVAGTATLAIAGTSLVYAQQRSDRDGAQRWRPNTEDMRAFGEARAVMVHIFWHTGPIAKENFR